jgi:4-hydroxy-tetrahydrodipicolinate synthase
MNAKAFARETVKGLWIAIPTPFTADGALDDDVLARSVEHYITQLQVDGIFCGGVMGEFWALSIEERRRVHATVAAVAAGRVPVMAQVGHHAVNEAAELANHAQESGAAFGIAMNPYYPPDLPFGLVRAWYEAFAERTSLPLFLFNTPYSGASLNVDEIAELAEIEIVCGIKNPRGREHLLALQARLGDRIVVADAAEREWLDLHTQHGFQALMSTPALALYQTPGNLPIVEYTRTKDRALSDSLGPARDAFEKWMRRPWLDGRVIPIAELKAWLELLGLPHGPVRAPLRPLSEERRRDLARDLEALGLLAA